MEYVSPDLSKRWVSSALQPLNWPRRYITGNPSESRVSEANEQIAVARHAYSVARRRSGFMRDTRFGFMRDNRFGFMRDR